MVYFLFEIFGKLPHKRTLRLRFICSNSYRNGANGAIRYSLKLSPLDAIVSSHLVEMEIRIAGLCYALIFNFWSSLQQILSEILI